MNNITTRPIGALLAAGGVCSSVFAELKRNPDIDPVPICITQGCESDARTAETLKYIPLTCPKDIAAYMHKHGVNEVVLAGDVGVLRDAPEQFIQAGHEFVPDPEMVDLIRGKAPIYTQLKILESKLKSDGIKSLHLNEVTSDFNADREWIGGAKLCDTRLQTIDMLKQIISEMRLSKAIENSTRTTLIFEDENLLFSWAENTYRAVEYAGSTQRNKRDSIISLVKLSTDAAPATLAAPTVCLEDITHCKEHGIDLIILDSDNIVFAEKQTALKTAADHGITVFGMSFS